MSTLSTAGRNAACNAICDLVDAGSGAGKLLIGTTGMASTLATITLNDPAFGDASTGVCTLDVDPAISDSSADNSGTAAAYQITDSDSTVILSGTVSTTGADINFDSVTFVAGGTVSITSLTVTVAAS